MKKTPPILLGLTLSTALAQNPEVEPTLREVRYGPHARQVLNFWKAEGDNPTPVVFDIQGGGWVRGGNVHSTIRRYPFLGRGVSVVSPSYRLADDALLPAPILDVARAVQFVRHKAEEWGLDRERVAFTGMSAGGCTALWLALHDDLADPENDDPVLRESTKPVCVMVRASQTFIDIRRIREEIGEGAASHRMVWYTLGAASRADALERYDELAPLYRMYSPDTHLDRDDPPVLLTYKASLDADDIHSAKFGLKLLEKARAAGAAVYLSAPGHPVGEDFPFNGSWEFLYESLLNRGDVR